MFPIGAWAEASWLAVSPPNQARTSGVESIFARLPAIGDNGAMLFRQIKLFAERLIIGAIGAHKVWFAAGCLYVAWKIAPLWVAVFPAAMGLTQLLTISCRSAIHGPIKPC